MNSRVSKSQMHVVLCLQSHKRCSRSSLSTSEPLTPAKTPSVSTSEPLTPQKHHMSALLSH